MAGPLHLSDCLDGLHLVLDSGCQSLALLRRELQGVELLGLCDGRLGDRRTLDRRRRPDRCAGSRNQALCVRLSQRAGKGRETNALEELASIGRGTSFGIETIALKDPLFVCHGL